jgi:hypothetical protein
MNKTNISWTQEDVRAAVEEGRRNPLPHGLMRENNNYWRGGRVIASNGYILIKVGFNHHLADIRGYAYEHRLVAEKILGRRLKGTEIIHHKDGNKTNNSPDNLEILDKREHRNHHRIKKRTNALRTANETNPLVSCLCGCGGMLRKYDRLGRPRFFKNGHNMKMKDRGAVINHE